MKLGTRVWGLITVVVVIALVAGGYFLGVAPLLEQRAQAEAARQAAATQNQALEAEIARLDKASKDLDKYQALVADFEKLVPTSVQSQRFIRTLDALAAANGVTVTRIGIDQFVPYQAPGVDPSAEVNEAAPPPYTDSRITDENFVIVPFSLTIEGGWRESMNFVRQLQFGDRLVLFTKIDQSIKDAAYSTEISAYMYVLVKPGSALPSQETVDTGDTGGADSIDDEAPAVENETSDDESASARG